MMTFKCVNNLAPGHNMRKMLGHQITSVYMLNDVTGKWKQYPSNSEPPPTGTVYCQLSQVSKVSCGSNPKLRNWYNVNIEYWLLIQTHNFSDLKS